MLCSTRRIYACKTAFWVLLCIEISLNSLSDSMGRKKNITSGQLMFVLEWPGGVSISFQLLPAESKVALKLSYKDV